VLSNAGFIAVADGIFGRNTARSLSDFQRHMGLKVNGTDLIRIKQPAWL